MALHPPSDFYRVAAHAARLETVVLASRFIADVIPVETEDNATAALVAARKEFHAATHHCWAWRIGAENPYSRSSDDGEPSGTAGKPILTALERHEITNTMIIVTRYFGGTKLGTGGLARAYADAAEQAMLHAEIITHVIQISFTIETPYEFLPRIKSLVYKIGKVMEESFGELPRLKVEVPRSECAALQAVIVDASRGKATIVKSL